MFCVICFLLIVIGFVFFVWVIVMDGLLFVLVDGVKLEVLIIMLFNICFVIFVEEIDKCVLVEY